MNTLVVYDSAYGNTAKVAQAIADALGPDASARRVTEIAPAALESLDLLVVGSPTQGGRPTAAIKTFLDAIPAGTLQAAAAFDTRMDPEHSGWFVRLVITFFGFAAPRIDQELRSKGARIAAEPQGFIVTGREGPLADGELERASAWAAGLQALLSARAAR